MGRRGGGWRSMCNWNIKFIHVEEQTHPLALQNNPLKGACRSCHFRRAEDLNGLGESALEYSQCSGVIFLLIWRLGKKRALCLLNILPSHLIHESLSISFCSMFFDGVEGNRGARFIGKAYFFYCPFKWEWRFVFFPGENVLLNLMKVLWLGCPGKVRSLAKLLLLLQKLQVLQRTHSPAFQYLVGFFFLPDFSECWE